MPNTSKKPEAAAPELPLERRLVGVNAKGRRVGETHNCAVLTDRDVELIFELREEAWGYRRLAAKFDCSKTLIRKILKGKVRCQHPTRFKVIA